MSTLYPNISPITPIVDHTRQQQDRAAKITKLASLVLARVRRLQSFFDEMPVSMLPVEEVRRYIGYGYEEFDQQTPVVCPGGELDSRFVHLYTRAICLGTLSKPFPADLLAQAQSHTLDLTGRELDVVCASVTRHAAKKAPLLSSAPEKAIEIEIMGSSIDESLEIAEAILSG